MTNQSQRRREATPFDWSELSHQQRVALGTAADLLADAVEALPERGKQQSPTELDDDRRSQMAFIDGDRGMGKTSLLLTLRQATRQDGWKAQSASGPKRATAKKTSPADAAARAEREEEAKAAVAVERLAKLRHHIVWLKTLDMEPISRTSNLFAAILARLGAAIPSRGTRPSMPLGLALGDKNPIADAHHVLGQLTTDVALAWDGAERGRAERLDPEAFAVEVMRAERAGLELAERLAGLLDTLAELSEWGRQVQNPLFVLPVDDFDLAPTRCLELLRLIRMVATPRLFFLVAGNSRMAEDMLRFQSLGVLGELAQGGGTSAAAELLQLQGAAMEIASNNARKLIPPNQRARLAELRLEEALRFSAGPQGPTLKTALNGIEVKRNVAAKAGAADTLLQFLLVDDPSVGYLALDWLGGTPRQTVDRVQMFARFVGVPDEWSERLLVALAEEVARQVREDWSLYTAQRDRIAKCFETRFGVRFNFHNAFKLSLDSDWFQDIPDSTGGLSIRIASQPEWWLRLARRPEEGQGMPLATLETPLPPRLAGGLTLLHDLAISAWGGYVPTAAIFYSGDGQRALVGVRWSGSGREDASIRWHIPEWWAIREYQRFAAHWSAHARESSTRDQALLGWIAAILEVVQDRPCDPKQRQVGQLAKSLELLALEEPTRYARNYLRDSALVCLALALCPESKASHEIAAALLKGPKIRAALSDGKIATRVRLWRALIHKSQGSASWSTLAERDRGRALVRAATCPRRELPAAELGVSTTIRYLESRGDAARPDTPADYNDADVTRLMLDHVADPDLEPGERAILETYRSLTDHKFAEHPANDASLGLVPTDEEIADANPESTRNRIRP